MFERSAIFNQLFVHRSEFSDALDERRAELDEWKEKNRVRVDAGTRKLAKPPFAIPRFLQFIRSAHIVSFRVKAKGETTPYEFSAVNAHFRYGDASKQKEKRALKFKALLAWLIDRARERERNYAEKKHCQDRRLARFEPRRHGGPHAVLSRSAMIRTLSTRTNLRSVPGLWLLNQENTSVSRVPSSDGARLDYDLNSAFQYASLINFDQLFILEACSD